MNKKIVTNNKLSNNKEPVNRHLRHPKRSNKKTNAALYRPNVGIIIVNKRGQLLWCRRHGSYSWQFAQGGIDAKETPVVAMYRELHEELGLLKEDVRIISESKDWYSYRFVNGFNGSDKSRKDKYIGQRQKWFFLELLTDDTRINLDIAKEFDHYTWVSYWYPLRNIINFKLEVYINVLKDFSELHQMFFAQHNSSQTYQSRSLKNNKF